MKGSPTLSSASDADNRTVSVQFKFDDIRSAAEDAELSAWQRSSRCVTANHCVEVARSSAVVFMRNSRNVDTTIAVELETFRQFIETLKTDAIAR